MSDAPPSLEGAQARIRDAFVAHDSGLFVLACPAGFGKSTTVERVAAEALAGADAGGVACPERRLSVVSFSREDAGSIEPGMHAAIDTLAEDDADSLVGDAATADRLHRRLRRSEYVGTIDKILGIAFRDIAAELGFAEMPTVGNDALLSTVRESCRAAVRTSAAHGDTFARVAREYADEDSDPATVLGELLEAAREAKRERRLDDHEFRRRLRATVKDAYPDGPPEDFQDLRADVEQFYDANTAETFENSYEGSEAEAVSRDRECYDTWTARVEEFCTLVTAYERAYDDACRERGVLAHGDVAYWVAAFFDPDDDAAGGGPETDPEFRERVRERHAAHFETLVIDEAQDVSVVQHDALAALVPDDARVLLAGDVNQCIYAWRNARPDLFARAARTGRYFGGEWSVHVTERGQRTYRMRPDVTAAVDAVFADVFADETRGGGVDIGDPYAPISTAREGTTTPSVHVATYRPTGIPGSATWFERGEAPVLAGYIESVLAADPFEDGTDSVTVLFDTRSNMDALAARLENRGLSVANASEYLFATPLVELVCAVVRWLQDPFDPERTKALMSDDAVPLPTETVADAGPDISGVDAARLDDTESAFVDGLRELASRRARHTADPGSIVVEDVVETLELATDPFDRVEDPPRSLATLDSLLAHVRDWEGEDRYTMADLAAVLGSYRDDPKSGPLVPAGDADAYDVVFRTMHNMKGDEDEVVCLADLSRPLGARGPHSETFVAHGETLALAPPPTVSRTPVDGGRDGHSGDFDFLGERSLRWATTHWVENGDGERLAGPPGLADVAAAHRADRWRLLYVAMTRARDHLVLSLPRPGWSAPPRDSRIETLQRALGYDRVPDGDTYRTTVPCPGGRRELTVGVNDVPMVSGSGSAPGRPTPRAALSPRETQTGWTPRYVNASTLYPLASDPDRHRLAHLLGRALHTDRDDTAADLALPLDDIGPDAVGTVVHDVLARAVDERVSTATLRACEGTLADALDASVRENGPGATRSERDAVCEYVRNTICRQFADTETWARLRASERRYVEDSLDAVLRVDGLDIETQNRVDVVSVAPDGTWYVDDLKVLLASPDDETRARYDLQTSVYGWLLRRQLPDGIEVVPALTHLGESVDTRRPTPPKRSIEAWLSGLG
ncbi:UvrD-helicase domain-containing protein [Haloarcula marina]|uniref:UvrD-helicase domain-containing protein n=1 Tax=Haloarcula marina TaxID=2961574 RepID=UPI0020B74442|nr:UvrD-helicase domain-containing protein [Halomicroarcula marina]